MNDKLKITIAFILGAMAGSVVAWKLTEKKYMADADALIDQLNEELAAVREEYSYKTDEEPVNTGTSTGSNNYKRHYHSLNEKKLSPAEYLRQVTNESNNEKDFEDHISLNEYNDLVEDFGYIPSTAKESEDEYCTDGPYVISPDEYGLHDDYDTENLTYYALDGFLVNDITNEPIEDQEHVTGFECLEHFGEFVGARDTVFVRNDELKIDYEICKVNQRYNEN